MKRISLTLQEPPDSPAISLIPIVGLMPYWASCLRRNCSLTISLEGPDEVIDELNTKILDQLPEWALNKIESDSHA